MNKKLRKKLYKCKSLKQFMELTGITAEQDMVAYLIVGYLVDDALDPYLVILNKE